MARRVEYVAWDAGVQDGLTLARVEAFGAIRRAAQHARTLEHLGKLDPQYADQANAIRTAIRAALTTDPR